MKIGIIGLQNSGKTTIFNALTGLSAETASFSTQKIEPNLGLVDVPDERIDNLTKMYEPKKTINAIIEYIDFVGLTSSTGNSDSFSGEAMSKIKNTDAIALVVRNFDDEVINQTLGEPQPLKDIDSIISEMIISDLIIAEKRLDKIAISKKRGIKDSAMVIEEKTLIKLIEHLNNEKPIFEFQLADEEKKSIRGFQFISQKPLMIILNSDESNFGENTELIQEIEKKHQVIEFAGNFEMELSQLDAEEALEFMEDMNIKQSARDRLTSFSYKLLGYISFFTVGKDEVRAWTITSGNNAVEAAGKIHSDLARGFIRAECFSYNDLISCGSEKGIREKGLFRLEGKNYIVQDGDILNIRFSV
ncbi:MAG: redox-regulated ATPase YchF [Candidatus Cloacimonetes bacterium]|nr:redox-regulated ATPase YchF [Candidatus Cloacimonadota bacterium]